MFSPSTRRLWPCFVLAAALPLAAAQKSIVIPLVSVSYWKLESVTKLDLQNLTKFGDQIDVDKELGVFSASERTYQLGDAQATAIFEEAADPSSAYALYTIYQNEDMRSVHGIDLAATGPRFALMTRGRYLIRVLRQNNPALADQDFRSLLIVIGGARLSARNIENLPAQLPARGLEPGTEKYLLGPVSAKLALPSFPANLIGFEDGAEAKAGTYFSNGQRMVLLEISYPTPQMAGLRFEQLVKALHVNRNVGPKSIYGRQQGSYALLVLNSKSQAAANRFLDRFKVNQVVSEIPPYPRKDTFVLQIVELVLANGELVIIIIVFALLGGVAIYSTKRLIMKLFPKSTWIRPDDDILIKLNISQLESNVYADRSERVARAGHR